ncbi:MAG: hypothetical protein AAFO01_16355 [Pseudomonadota bacterium]
MPVLFRRYVAFVAWTLSLILALPLPPSRADEASLFFPQAELCQNADHELSDRAIVSPQSLLAWLLNHYEVRDSILDANGDGNTLVEEKVRALTEEKYCSSTAKACTDDDQAMLDSARQQLRAFIAAKGGIGYEIERIGGTDRVTLQSIDVIRPRDLLIQHNPTVQIRCTPLPVEEEALGDEAYWHEARERDGGFRLAGDVDNLNKSRGALGAVKAAQLSITGDLIEDETAYRINAVAGYAFQVDGGDDIVTTFIPFIEGERVTSGSTTQIDTLGAGFQQAATINWPGQLISEFAVTPVYRTDSNFDSQTGTMKFRWTPSFSPVTGIPLGFAHPFGPVELRFGLDFLADAGRVFVEGDGNNLDGEGTFFRLGNQASVQIRGAPKTLFRPFELQIANRYLHNVDTNLSDINQFDAAIAYIFPGSENYQLSFAYSNGRDENSLELYEFWQTQFGIRF